MKAVITVIGKDSVGILAKVSEACSKADVNIVEVTQSVLQDMFAMIMLVEIDKSNIGFEQLVQTSKQSENQQIQRFMLCTRTSLTACTEFDQCYRIERIYIIC